MRGRSARSRNLALSSVCACALVASLLGASAAASAPRRVPAQAASGTIRIAAEEEPTCADWIASCAGSSWGNWALGNLTLPQALQRQRGR